MSAASDAIALVARYDAAFKAQDLDTLDTYKHLPLLRPLP